jgi:hypothetical protein
MAVTGGIARPVVSTTTLFLERRTDRRNGGEESANTARMLDRRSQDGGNRRHGLHTQGWRRRGCSAPGWKRGNGVKDVNVKKRYAGQGSRPTVVF